MKLSPRQTEVLALICEGKSNKQIGLRLHISEATVKVHASKILSRLGVHSRWEAAVMVKLKPPAYEG